MSPPVRDHKDTRIGLVPLDWQVVSIGRLGTDFFSGGTPSTKNDEYWNGDIPWVTSAYIEEELHLESAPRHISLEGLNNSSSKLVPSNNLLIGTRVGVGKVAINLMDIAISQDLTAMIVDKSTTDVEFLAYAIRSAPVQQAFKECTRGTTIKGIPREDVLNIGIPLPSIDEQRRIAHVLSIVQCAREATGQVIAAAHQLKRSLMRHLFTYGPVPVDQVDQVQLKDTEIGPVSEEWRVNRCEELCEKISVGIVVRPASHYVAVGVPALRSLNIREDRLALDDLVFVSEQANDTTLAKSKLQAGDVLIVRTGYPGTSCVVPEKFNDSNCIDLVFARPDGSVIISEYLSRYFNSEQGKRQVLSSKTGLAQKHLNVSAVKNTKIATPPVEIQAQTVQVLKDLDRKIAIEENRKAALDALFKSLLHQLMTGCRSVQRRRNAHGCVDGTRRCAW